jgi:hypothetical protein
VQVLNDGRGQAFVRRQYRRLWYVVRAIKASKCYLIYRGENWRFSLSRSMEVDQHVSCNFFLEARSFASVVHGP